MEFVIHLKGRGCVWNMGLPKLCRRDYCLNLVRREELDAVKTKMYYMGNLNAISK